MDGDGRCGRARRGWSDLPGDILDMVYRGCCFSPYDRIRFAAVCSSWSYIASWHPKLPPLPLLLPSTGNAKRDQKARAYILEEGRALSAPLRGFPCGKRIVGSYDGGWLAAVAGTRLLVVNAFTGARVTLSAKQSIIGGKRPTRLPRFKTNSIGDDTYITKIIFSEDPSSSACILVAITTRGEIAFCGIGCKDGWWTTGVCGAEDLLDVAFCNGKLYCLAYSELIKFDVGMNDNGAPVVTSVHRMHIKESIWTEWGSKSDWKYYIFELCDKLAIAVKFLSTSLCCEDHCITVFQLMDDKGTWEKVESLGDHALFLGPACCRAVRVPLTGERSEVERSRIYYSVQQLCPHHETKCLKRLDLGSYTVYYVKSKCENRSLPIMSWGYHYDHKDDNNSCIWLLPPDL